MATQFQSYGRISNHEDCGSGVLRSRFLRALNLLSESDLIDQSDLRVPISVAGQAPVEDGGRAALLLCASDSDICQEMLAMGDIDLSDFESLDALPSATVAGNAGAQTLDEFSDDPGQLWFDETVTTMFMEDADKPKSGTSAVAPRMETTAWPLDAVASIDEAFADFVEGDEIAEAETAAQLKAQAEIPPAPTPATFLDTEQHEVDVESADEAGSAPMKPGPADDVPAPALGLPFAAMLEESSIGESGKRGFGVKLTPSWKPLRGQKLNSPAKTIAASSGADHDVADDRDAAFGAEQEWVAATLRAPRQDSILDGFGQFLEEQVILSAAIDEPDFKALASSFDGKAAESISSGTEWQSVASNAKAGAVLPEPPSAAASRVKTEWISGSPTTGGDALSESSQPISAPSLLVDDQARGFSGGLLNGAEPAGSFFDDLEDGSASMDKGVTEKVADPQTMTEAVTPEVALPPSDDISVSALGYARSRTNPALFKHEVTCPSCRVKLQIQARYLNIEGKCPGCSEMIVARQRGMVEPIVELATGRYPSFDCQPELEPSDVPGGTVLSEAVAADPVPSKTNAPPAQVAAPEVSSFDPFSNPNRAIRKNRQIAVGDVWGPTSGKGLS